MQCNQQMCRGLLKRHFSHMLLLKPPLAVAIQSENVDIVDLWFHIMYKYDWSNFNADKLLTEWRS